MGLMISKLQGDRPEGRRKDELEDEGRTPGRRRQVEMIETKGKGRARMELSGNHTVEGRGYWRWDIVGSTESHQFRTPARLVKGRMERGVWNPTLTIDLSAPIQAVERCMANSIPPLA
jgi:hypothetical protein